MPSKAQGLISRFRTIVPAGVTALLLTSAAPPLPAQDSVPATAVQAAKTPEFAPRLAGSVHRPASRPNPAPAGQESRSGQPQSGPIYNNGPINGTSDAWTINFGYVVSDTITLNGSNPVTGFDLGVWEIPGDVVSSLQWSITSEPNGGTVYGSGTVSGSSLNDTFISTNQYGYNIDKISASGLNVGLNSGTFWFNLQNASVPNGDPVYWDENSGIGCTSPGCPSQAVESASGTIPSEAFDIGGNGSPVCFGSAGKLQIIYNFTPQQGSGGGVTIDKAGKLYGTTGGGDNGAGLAFRLAHFAEWLFDPLFSFLGGNSGGPPNGVIVGHNGSLYGGAQGGIQNCGSDGSQYCGLVYNLVPQPTACFTALCSWSENVPYRFSGENDGSGGVNVSASDQEGNLYGTTSSGGTYAAGTVFELTPSGGGWRKTTLYSFTGGSNSAPSQVLIGNDGNLYGLTNGDLYGLGVVFQLTPSGGQWTESVLYDFQSGGGYNPGYLVQDSAGNLYGIATMFPFGTIFMLEKTGSGWVFSEYLIRHNGEFDALNNLGIDAAGKLYGTGYGGTDDCEGRGNTSSGGLQCYYTYIFKAWHDSNGWHYQDLDFLPNTYFPATGSLALDTSGNLYGTTWGCGASGSGTVWQLSP